MSAGLRIPADEARRTAETVLDGLADLCAELQIAGSLRRGAASVGDIEIVARPRQPREFLARLDGWIASGKASKAVYSNGTHRWGSLYRGLLLMGHDARVEVFLADADNWGYQFWLRTGPADCGKYVMGRLISGHAPYAPVGGYWWEGGHDTAHEQKIAVPDEAELFRLWGSPYIPPAERTLANYARWFSAPKWATSWTFAEADEPAATQQEMF